jgi:hypothetical protein
MKQPPTKQEPISKTLEARALAIVRVAALWQPSPASGITRQIALTLEELSRVRATHRALMDDLLRAECAVDTDLMQPIDPGERSRQQGRLFTIETERRRLQQATNDQLRALRHQLLDLLNKQQHLDPDEN